MGTEVPEPDTQTLARAFAYLQASEETAGTFRVRREGDATPDYLAAAPIVAEHVRAGETVARVIGTTSLRDTLWDVEDEIDRAARANATPDGVATPPEGAAASAWVLSIPTRVSAPTRIPLLHTLQLAALHDGVAVRYEGKLAIMTPTQMQLEGRYESALFPYMPYVGGGTDLVEIASALAEELGLARPEPEPETQPESEAQPESESQAPPPPPRLSRLLDQGASVRIVRFATYSAPPSLHASRHAPPPAITPASLRQAAGESADFLLRHQRFDGLYAYEVSAQSGARSVIGYNPARHAGVTYFLAQAGRQLGLPRATAGAHRGLDFAQRWIRECGSPESLCLVAGDELQFGATALLAVALYELRSTRDTPQLRTLHRGLLNFLVAQQRPDGEMQHGFDLERGEPIDIQLMYYSGEAALALVRGAAMEGDALYQDSARRLVRHLGLMPRDFVGHAYLMGEDHWTCIAYGELRQLLEEEIPATGEYCLDWAAYSRGLQFEGEQTLWDAHGSYGFLPLLRPRLTAAGSRTEAFAAIALAPENREDEALRAQVERGAQALIRHQFHLEGAQTRSAGHLMHDAEELVGGIPGAPGELMVRNDFVQHAGSAYLRALTYLEARSEPD